MRSKKAETRNASEAATTLYGSVQHVSGFGPRYNQVYQGELYLLFQWYLDLSGATVLVILENILC